MKHSLIIFAFFGFVTLITSFAHAQSDAAVDPLTGEIRSDIDTSNLSLEDAIDLLKPVFDADEDGGAFFYSDNGGLHSRFDAKGADCSEFIEADGAYGTRGEVIASAFRQYEHLDALLADKAAKGHSMAQLCPKFAKLSREQRIRFWVWTFAAISWDESTCKTGLSNKRATNGTAIGLLQLEVPLKKRYWRGPLCKFASVSATRENLLCGLEIMRGQFEGMYSVGRCRGQAGLSMGCSYWQKLRKNWSPVHQLITLFPGCK